VSSPDSASVRPARWRSPESQAAITNGAVAVLVPTVLAAITAYRSTAVRPVAPTIFSVSIGALPILVAVAPIGLVTMWRTYVHASAYRQRRRTVWRGALECTAVWGGIALMLLILATARAGTWSREPSSLVLAYVGLYAGIAALVGLAMGLTLTATALLVLHLRWRHT
jgi:hypothetical protein